MNITFDVNLWTLLAFLLNLYAINSARSRATSEDIDKRISTVRTEIGELRERHSATFIRMGERLQALETEQKNSITDDDIVAVHRRIDKLQDDMHAGLERLNRSNARIGESVARIEGLMQGWASKNPREHAT